MQLSVERWNLARKVFKQEEQPLHICGENWVWFDPVLSVLISHIGHAVFTLCHFEVIFGVLPSKGCCTAHALAVQWTHIFLPKSNTEGRRLFLKCALQTVQLKTSCSQQRKRFWHVYVPEFKEHSWSGRRNDQRCERDQELLVDYFLNLEEGWDVLLSENFSYWGHYSYLFIAQEDADFA